MMAYRRMRAQQKFNLLDVASQCTDYSLLFPCSISFAESFATRLRNKAHVYLLTVAGQINLVGPSNCFTVMKGPKCCFCVNQDKLRSKMCALMEIG